MARPKTGAWKGADRGLRELLDVLASNCPVFAAPLLYDIAARILAGGRRGFDAGMSSLRRADRLEPVKVKMDAFETLALAVTAVAHYKRRPESGAPSPLSMTPDWVRPCAHPRRRLASRWRTITGVAQPARGSWEAISEIPEPAIVLRAQNV
jgi:hypothetical protein